MMIYYGDKRNRGHLEDLRSPVRASLSWETLWPALFLSTRIRSSVSWLRWQSVEAASHGSWKDDIHVTRIKTSALSLRAPYPQALTLSRGAKFLEECRRVSRNFWNHQACLGYSLAPGFHNKKALCHTCAYIEPLTNSISAMLVIWNTSWKNAPFEMETSNQCF